MPSNSFSITRKNGLSRNGERKKDNQNTTKGSQLQFWQLHIFFFCCSIGSVGSNINDAHTYTHEKYRINIPSPEFRIPLNLCINDFQKPTASVVKNHWTGCIQSLNVSLIAIVLDLLLFISLFNSTICSYFLSFVCQKIEQKLSLRIRINHLIIIPSIVNATNRTGHRKNVQFFIFNIEKWVIPCSMSCGLR